MADEADGLIDWSRFQPAAGSENTIFFTSLASSWQLLAKIFDMLRFTCQLLATCVNIFYFSC